MTPLERLLAAGFEVSERYAGEEMDEFEREVERDRRAARRKEPPMPPPAEPRYLIADDWTHLNSMDEEYDLRWVIDRETGELVAAEYATARGRDWRPVGRGRHWEDVGQHLGDNQLPERYAAWGDALRLADAPPEWAAAQIAQAG